MSEINQLTVALARPWSEAPSLGGRLELAAAGQAFPREYPSFEQAL
jgi:hypothetical protein